MTETELSRSPLMMLRQGRGNGFREALRAGRSASADVLSCVIDDPRWDRQVEEREGYYASLLLRLDIDIAPVAERVLREEAESDDSALWLPIGVLAEMARRTNEPARVALAEAIRRARNWRACLDALEATGGEALIGAVIRPRDIEALVRSADVDALIDASQTVAAPWSEWATEVSALRFVRDNGGRTERARKPLHGPVHWVAARIRIPTDPGVNSSLTTEQLLDLVSPGTSRQIEEILRGRSDEATARSLYRAATEGSPEQRIVALALLGERGCDDFLDAAEHFLRDESGLSQAERRNHRTRRAFLRYVERLPSRVTLERARAWFKEPWPLSLAGEQILAQHATGDDRAILEEAGSAALTSDDMHRLCSIVDALATIGARDSIAFLRDVYSTAPYSYARWRAVLALLSQVGIDDVARNLVVEALWDCETRTRELACGAVSTASIANVRRLSELADDAFEDAAVRASARRARGPSR